MIPNSLNPVKVVKFTGRSKESQLPAVKAGDEATFKLISSAAAPGCCTNFKLKTEEVKSVPASI